MLRRPIDNMEIEESVGVENQISMKSSQWRICSAVTMLGGRDGPLSPGLPLHLCKLKQPAVQTFAASALASSLASRRSPDE